MVQKRKNHFCQITPGANVNEVMAKSHHVKTNIHGCKSLDMFVGGTDPEFFACPRDQKDPILSVPAVMNFHISLLRHSFGMVRENFENSPSKT